MNAVKTKNPETKNPETSLSIELPLPPQELHPNRRKGQSRLSAIIRSRKIKDTRAMAKTVAQAEWPSGKVFTGRVRFDAHFWLPRKSDDDGLFLWVKQYRDGLADMGIVKNDSQFKIGEATFTTGRDVGRKVVITLTGSLVDK